MPMIKAGIKEARQNLTGFLNKVLKGEEVVITKRGEPIAKISPVSKRQKGNLSSHKTLREALSSKGKPLSEVITELRREERF
jgi:prevent-host-death family protein